MLKVEGVYSLELNNKAVRCFNNLILSGFFRSLGFSSLQAVVGKGDAPPDFEQTSLGNLLATSERVSLSEAAEYSVTQSTYTIKRSFRAPISTNLDDTLHEIGVTGSGRLLSRSLIKDSQGNLAPVIVAPEDSLSIRYDMIFHLPKVPEKVSLTIAEGEGIQGKLYFVNPTSWFSESSLSTPFAVSQTSSRFLFGNIGGFTISADGQLHGNITPEKTVSFSTFEWADGAQKGIKLTAYVPPQERWSFRYVGIYKGNMTSSGDYFLIIEFEDEVHISSNDELNFAISIMQGG